MLKNSESQYGSVAKWLHWLTAIWILVAYISVYYLHWVLNSEGPLRSPIIRFHKGLGFSVLLFFALRLGWRMVSPGPKLPSSMPKWQIQASHASHFLLYFFLIAMPISGYLGNSSGVTYGFFSIPGFGHTGIGQWVMGLFNVTFEEWEVPFDFFHYQIAGPLILWILIAVHAGAAIYHHYVEKDDVLTRMLPGGK